MEQKQENIKNFHNGRTLQYYFKGYADFDYSVLSPHDLKLDEHDTGDIREAITSGDMYGEHMLKLPCDENGDHPHDIEEVGLLWELLPA